MRSWRQRHIPFEGIRLYCSHNSNPMIEEFGLPGIITGVAWLILLVMCGCGARDSLPLAPVHGIVTCQGKPLDHGQVVFSPESGDKGVLSVGAITGGGAFEMRTGARDGAALGKHVVTVHCRQLATAQQARDLRDPKYVLPSLIPEKYGNDRESPLRFEVRSGSNDCPIELK